MVTYDCVCDCSMAGRKKKAKSRGAREAGSSGAKEKESDIPSLQNGASEQQVKSYLDNLQKLYNETHSRFTL